MGAAATDKDLGLPPGGDFFNRVGDRACGQSDERCLNISGAAPSGGIKVRLQPGQ